MSLTQQAQAPPQRILIKLQYLTAHKHQHIEFLYTIGQDTPENIIEEMQREL